MTATPHHLVLLGPTASGKTGLALRIAHRYRLEIVSCDSMQVYRGLEIGTAQPTREEQLLVPHHLIGILDIRQPYDVNRFLDAIRPILEDLEARGRSALIVGGTGLYARSLVYGHALLPANPEVAQRLQRELQQPGGQEVLAQRLRAATRPENIPPDTLLNPRRLLRACEVLELTGRPPWEIHPKDTPPSPRFRQICLLPEFEELKQRIRARSAQMLQDGWLDEARAAIADGLIQTPTARQALGYRDLAEYLNGTSPAHSLPELTELLANRTIQYARRQYTWFRHQHPGATIANTIDEAETAANALLEQE